jgi:PAS domain S-box-containing protein
MKSSAPQAMDLMYRKLVEQAYDGFWFLDKNFMTVYVNPALEKMLGYTTAEMIGRSWYDFGDPAWIARAKELEKRRESGIQEPHPFLFVHKDGRTVLTRIATTPLFDDEGNFDGTIGIVSDLKADSALRESEVLFKKLFTEAPLGIALIDSLTGQIYEVNTKFAEIAGRTIAELAHIDWTSITHPDDSQKYLDNMALLNAGRIQGFQMEKRYLHPDGSSVWISMTVAPVNVENKAHPRHLCMIQDITKHKRLEKVLQDSEDAYRTVADFTFDWEYWQAPDGTLRYISPSCELHSGYSREEFLHDTGLIERIIHPDDLNEFSKHQRVVPDEALQPHQHQIEFRITTKSGEERWIGHVCQSVYDGESNYLGQRASNRDITDRKHAEAIINQLQTELEQRVTERTAQLKLSYQEMESFAYSVSHDLRAPLRSIDGFSLALLEDYGDSLDEGGKDYLRRIRCATQKMAQLIDDILKLSRITRCELTLETVNLTKMAEIIADELQGAEPERKVEFVIAKGLKTRGDSALLKVVLDNLLGNAWKFTGSHAEARIECGSAKVDGKTAFFIRDDGAGFDVKYADKLFVTFQRLHTEQEFSGTGIGLSLVQQIIHRHGGRVWGEGAVEHGATFWFTIGG